MPYLCTKISKGMALTLNTSIDGKKFYSCDFPDLSISTNYGLANVTIVVNGSTALSTRYYAVSGRVTVRNLVPLIELSMEQQNKSYCLVGVSVSVANESVSASCSVLLCKVKCMTVDVDTFLANSFLTTHNHRLTTLYNEEVLPFFIAGSGSYSVGTFYFTLNVRKNDGSYDSYEYISGRRFGYGIVTSTISVKELQWACEAHFGSGTQLLSFTLKFNSRLMHFYIVPCASAQEFRFKNIFGCMESLGIPGATISKLESDFSEAMVDGRLQHYDVKHTRTFEVQTAQLLSGYMTWLEQFLTSSFIMRKLPDGMFADVLIKEYSFEQTDAPGEENTLNFTWIFSDQRETPHRYTYNVGIFTEQFNDIFA